MRIFAITERHLQRARPSPGLRPALPLIGEGKPLRDRRIVGRRQREGFASEHLTKLDCRTAMRIELLKQGRIIRRIGDDRDMRMILCRRAHHGRTTDVDILDDRVAVRTAHYRVEERV